MWLTDGDWKIEIVSKKNAAQCCHSLTSKDLPSNSGFVDLRTFVVSGNIPEVVVTDDLHIVLLYLIKKIVNFIEPIFA